MTYPKPYSIYLGGDYESERAKLGFRVLVVFAMERNMSMEWTLELHRGLW